jgi:TRAP-type mannitol/chloroaromatic compound transport system permease small subunit
MKTFASIGKFIEGVSTWSGKAVAWLCLILVMELVYDTIARYGFNAPTEWSYDISYMLYGTMFMIGAAYTLLLDEHVRIGVLYDRVSDRSRAIINVMGYIIFFFPVTLALLWYGTDYAIQSWKITEHAGVSMWSPPIYPFKTVIPVAAFLLLLQGIVEFVRSLISVTKGGNL